jgi:HTH-type transcriptional regulator / antitoxin HigA
MDIENFKTPGQLIEALLAKRGWTQRLFAEILNVDETGLNKIISGKKPVNAHMAIVLGEVFGVPAEDFLSLQKEYDLAQARIVARPDADRVARAILLGDLPIKEMIKRGWIEPNDSRDAHKIELSLTKFFKVSSINDIEILPHAAKKTNTFYKATPAQMAWIYRVKQIAEGILVEGRYSPANVRNAVARLNDLRLYPEETQKVPRIMSECGIRFVIVETLSSAKIDGVCFWLNDFAPIIGMTLRYDRIDNFWFVLRHEIEHVLRGHGRDSIMLDAELEGERAGTGENISKEEKMANEAAADFCASQKRLESFIARKSPLFHDRDIIGLANTLKIHPGLVVGQLQRKTGKFNLFRQYLVNIRHNVTLNAMVDGWGDIAPII